MGISHYPGMSIHTAPAAMIAIPIHPEPRERVAGYAPITDFSSRVE
jgi:hypothetical protein